jgi:L-malate glycosyltransferase
LVADLERQRAPVLLLESPSILGGFLGVPRLARCLRRWRIDLLHAHLPLSGAAARLAGRIVGVPVIYTEHNLLERYGFATRWMNLVTWRLQEQVIAVSPAVADSIAGRAGRIRPVTVIPNGVDTGSFRPCRGLGLETRQRFDVPEDAPLVGTVAVLSGQKRLEDWMRVAGLVHSIVPRSRFVVVGDGPVRRSIEAFARELDLEDKVRFVGLQEDVRPFLAAMDVFLMTSEFEGLPVALLEALAMGVPVVATSVGGVPDVVQQGETGLLAPMGRTGELSHAVISLLTDPDLRESMGRRGRSLVEKSFSLAAMQRRTEELYAAVLVSRRESRARLPARHS